MTSAMFSSVTLTLLIHLVLVSHRVQCVDQGVLDLPWQDEWCCDSPDAHSHTHGAHNTTTTTTNYTHCRFSSPTGHSHSAGSCLEILCTLGETWENLTCDLRNHLPAQSGRAAISLRRLMPNEEDAEVNEGVHPVTCGSEDPFMCSLPLDSPAGSVVMVTLGIQGSVAEPVLLRIPARPVRPSPPVNLSHLHTIEAELILTWDVPSDSGSDPVRYEVRYSSDTTHPDWKVLSTSGARRVSAALQPRLHYTAQVRAAARGDPALWSGWSEPHHFYLDTVSYIPEKVVSRPGDNVTVYCVFNDRSSHSSSAHWKLNFRHTLPSSQWQPVNQWVSRITVRSPNNRMYDLLQCTKHWTIPYSQIYVEGASIDIKCETNGYIDAMECSWKNPHLTTLKFRHSWADLPCDVMQERETGGEAVGETGPPCLTLNNRQRSCVIQPLRMNCYKLWMEIPSGLGPIRSKPVYLTPIDYVKPHTASNVLAETHVGLLRVQWEPPALPVDGLQCQSRYRVPSTSRNQSEWKVQGPVQESWVEVAVPDMCTGYVVQVRCGHTRGAGYWSEWSESVYSSPHNSRVPERGPDFWRILQDDPNRNQTNVTLLFKHVQMSGLSYCVDGLVVQRRDPGGSVTREKMDVGSSFSLEWDRRDSTVTVEAYNSMGSSTNNFHMTLQRQPKRRSLRWFSVSVVNSSCVSLSWSLLDNSSVPLSMVVQWSPWKREDSSHHGGQSGQTWARLSYTDRPVYLRGDFFGSDDSGFYLFPVFADGEGEPMYAKATREDPAAYIMLAIISFLSIVLFVTLVLNQNKMKSLVWKDVPNPNKCSWAKGLDLKQADTFDHVFHPPEGLPVWPLLSAPENISKVVIVDKADLSSLSPSSVETKLNLDPTKNLHTSAPLWLDTHVDHQTLRLSDGPMLRGSSCCALDLDSLTNSRQGADRSHPVEPAEDSRSSAQCSVTYATVLHQVPKQQEEEQQQQLPSVNLRYKEGSGSSGSSTSSSDEGNFSANNSDISGSFRDINDPRRSRSYNSVEDISETSEQEDDDEKEVREEKDLYYLGTDYPQEEEEEEEEESEEGMEERGGEERNVELLKSVVLNGEDCSVESDPLLSAEDGFCSLYMPQFRTAQRTSTALQ